MSKSESGYIKLNRSAVLKELLKNYPNAFLLLSIIALRARRSDDYNFHNLEIGEAEIGDYYNFGLTEMTYRTAKKKLTNNGLATFKSTNKGTIAKLCNTMIYDINQQSLNEQDNNQITDKERTNNEQDNSQITTIKKERSKEVKNNKKIDIAQIDPNFRENNYSQTASQLRTDIFFSFELRTFQNISLEDLSIWKETYPAVDVKQEILEMVQWCLSNLTKAKSKSQWRKFITTWLKNNNEKSINKQAYRERNNQSRAVLGGIHITEYDKIC